MAGLYAKDVTIVDYDYDLPDEKIAKYPLPQRDESKLLVYDDGTILESSYKNLAEYLAPDTMLVFNDTKVVEARLLFAKATGGTIELFCLEPGDQYPDITTAMKQKGTVFWKCLVGGAKKWKEGGLYKKINEGKEEILLKASIKERLDDCFIIEFAWDNADTTFGEILHLAGVIPLPPYLKRESNEADKTSYQTIYAKQDGSVAAPTAGLHFTESLFDSLTQKGITHDFVTLHVGAGTFMPVKAAKIQDHIMHSEFIDVPIALIEKLITKKNIVPVGTTSLRTLESLYWLGVKAIGEQGNGEAEELILRQWDAYELPQDIKLEDALLKLIDWLKARKLDRLVTKTQLFITPRYRLRVANAIVTNFHQPKSTLLLLVSAIVGDDWRRVYDYALENDFRFLSYGDGCLLFCPKNGDLRM